MPTFESLTDILLAFLFLSICCTGYLPVSGTEIRSDFYCSSVRYISAILSSGFPFFLCVDGLCLHNLPIQHRQFYCESHTLAKGFLASCLNAGKFLNLCAWQPDYTEKRKKKRHRIRQDRTADRKLFISL